MPVSINGQTGVITGLAVGGLPDGIIQTADLADDAVTIAKLSATGTASGSTFLRGDGAFAEAGGGKVVQIKTANFTSQFSFSNNSSFTASNITVDITPTSASNKILVTASCNVWKSASAAQVCTTVYRDSTNLGVSPLYGFGEYQISSSGSGSVNWHVTYNDSPNTTSQITYKVYTRVQSGYSGMLGANNVPTNITAIEYST